VVRRYRRADRLRPRLDRLAGSRATARRAQSRRLQALLHRHRVRIAQGTPPACAGAQGAARRRGHARGLAPGPSRPLTAGEHQRPAAPEGSGASAQLLARLA